MNDVKYNKPMSYRINDRVPELNNEVFGCPESPRFKEKVGLLQRVTKLEETVKMLIELNIKEIK